MKKCPFCAEDIQDEAIYCRFCGHYLSNSKVTVIDENEQKLEALLNKWNYFEIPIEAQEKFRDVGEPLKDFVFELVELNMKNDLLDRSNSSKIGSQVWGMIARLAEQSFTICLEFSSVYKFDRRNKNLLNHLTELAVPMLEVVYKPAIEYTAYLFIVFRLPHIKLPQNKIDEVAQSLGKEILNYCVKCFRLGAIYYSAL